MTKTWKVIYIAINICLLIVFYLFSPAHIFAATEPSALRGAPKSNTITSYQDRVDKLQEELDKAKHDLHQANIDAFNRSSDAANRLINWVGIIATIYGIIIAIASLFIGFIAFRNQKRSEEALKTLEGAKSYVNQTLEGAKSYVNKMISEFDDIVKRKNEEINKKLNDFIQLSLEQLTQDTQEATKKVKEIEEKGITTEASKKIELLERKIKIFEDIGMPDDPKVLYSKAMVYKEKQELHEALELLHKAIQRDPKYQTAYFQIGYIQNILKEFDKTIAAYDKAIELNPKDSASWNNKGVSLENMGKLKDALDCYNKAIEISPGVAIYHKNKIGILDKNENNIDELLKSYDSLLKIEPDNWDQCLKAGRLLSTLGRTQDSVKYYKLYLEDRKKKSTGPDARELDHLCFYEALLLIQDYAEVVSFKSKMDNAIKGEGEQVIYTLLNSYLLFLQGQDEQAQLAVKNAIELIRKSSYVKLEWNFDDINILLGNKLHEKKYQLCLTIQKAAKKEVTLDSLKIDF
jgi:tetratricopeptide (TPR) repeat protein